MGWIKLEDGTFAEEALPDPRRILNTSQVQDEVKMKEQEIVMYENEILHLTERKNKLQTEVVELNNLLINN